MNWTDERKLAYLLRLPWTFVTETTPEEDLLVRVAEVPAAVGTGATLEEIASDAWEALSDALRAHLHFGDPVPLPAGSSLPWAAGGVAPALSVVKQRVRTPDAALSVDTETAPVAGWQRIAEPLAAWSGFGRQTGVGQRGRSLEH